MRRLLLVVLLATGLASAGPVAAAPAPDPSCSWTPAAVAPGESSTMTAINLPTNRLITFSFTPFPNGGGIETDGTFVLSNWVLYTDTTVYIWTRGGGGALFKPGKQLNDYHPIAMCSVEVGATIVNPTVF